ncbi:uncharacterized protein V1518DRAFT_417013 [Limtongia smithiae]|uniref:uncharacterized protein n=1 Tax=Limtongia smithiae TaxID=1125753 RepID=UPI0034D000EB
MAFVTTSSGPVRLSLFVLRSQRSVLQPASRRRTPFALTCDGQFVADFVTVSSGNNSRARNTSSSTTATRGFHSTAVTLDGKTDPYGSLGIGKSASAGEIKKAYYALAKKYHPDVNKDEGAEKRFHDIQAAYEILSDKDKKAAFDAYGSAAFDESGGGGAPGGGGQYNPYSNFGGFGFGGAGFGSKGGFNMEDLFNAFAGAGAAGGAGRSSRGSTVQEYRGNDIEVVLRIPFMDAAKGASKDIHYNPDIVCQTCSGSGLKPGKKNPTCPSCRGTGTQIHMTDGGFSIGTTCAKCDGTGVYIDKNSACGTCNGQGVTKAQRTTTVDIPAGIEDGMRLRVVGEGDAPPVKASKNVRVHRGDLYVRVKVQPHPSFTRNGPNLSYTAEIPMTTAALGGRVRVPTLDGEADLTVPPATQSGTTVTMTGMGMPVVQRRSVGDLRVTFKVNTLRPTTAEQTRLLEQLADSFNDTNARRSGSSSK